MFLPISKLPAQVLRNPVEEVVFPLDKKMKRLLMDMLDTVQSAEGIGLAATQVGKSLNLALIFLAHQGKEPFFICNPKIIKTSKEEVAIEEGCLSIPGVYGMVSRPKKITVEYFDLLGEKQTIEDDGWTARVLQHEIDHLNNILICDKFKTITKGGEMLKHFNP